MAIAALAPLTCLIAALTLGGCRKATRDAQGARGATPAALPDSSGGCAVREPVWPAGGELAMFLEYQRPGGDRLWLRGDGTTRLWGPGGLDQRGSLPRASIVALLRRFAEAQDARAAAPAELPRPPANVRLQCAGTQQLFASTTSGLGLGLEAVARGLEAQVRRRLQVGASQPLHIVPWPLGADRPLARVGILGTHAVPRLQPLPATFIASLPAFDQRKATTTLIEDQGRRFLVTRASCPAGALPPPAPPPPAGACQPGTVSALRVLGRIDDILLEVWRGWPRDSSVTLASVGAAGVELDAREYAAHRHFYDWLATTAQPVRFVQGDRVFLDVTLARGP